MALRYGRLSLLAARLDQLHAEIRLVWRHMDFDDRARSDVETNARNVGMNRQQADAAVDKNDAADQPRARAARNCTTRRSEWPR